jgi:hypothetical protein
VGKGEEYSLVDPIENSIERYEDFSVRSIEAPLHLLQAISGRINRCEPCGV